jgi:hypothetical protein
MNFPISRPAIEQRLADVPVMVVGTPRSGTTLVQRLVTEECGLAGAPESHFFTLVPVMLRRSGSLEKALRAYATAPQLRGCRLDVDALLEVVGPGGGTLYDVFRAVMHQLAQGAEAVCEKTPGHLWSWQRLTRRTRRLQLVIVVRDPRAVVASLRTARFTAHPIAVLAEQWRVDAAMARRAQRALGPGRVLLLRYEDVVASEGRARQALARFRPPRTPPAAVQRASGPIVLPWEHWKEGATQAVTRDREEAWRAELTADEIAQVEFVCRRTMAWFGYVASQPRPGFPALLRQVAGLPPRLRYRLAVAAHVRRLDRIRL